jgi:hypothetical protein
LEIVGLNAKFKKFTYKKLVSGLKMGKFKKVLVVTGAETSKIPIIHDLFDL